ncbi:hypothetical protein, partial [Enterobacter hormaechei]|uniref:hypothetical protein n=1 Tax=Enterobacter hormaechei TaxID=158836 RepID=UPI001954CEB9
RWHSLADIRLRHGIDPLAGLRLAQEIGQLSGTRPRSVHHFRGTPFTLSCAARCNDRTQIAYLEGVWPTLTSL